MSPAPSSDHRKRSVMIAGHRTSVSLEEEFWDALREIAVSRRESVQALIAAVDAERGQRNLSSAIRVFVLGEARRTSEKSYRSETKFQSLVTT